MTARSSIPGSRWRPPAGYLEQRPATGRVHLGLRQQDPLPGQVGRDGERVAELPGVEGPQKPNLGLHLVIGAGRPAGEG